MAQNIRVKICGVTTPEDAALAAQLGADAIGLNFYRPSPRFVEDSTALAILRALPPFVQAVGVFVNETLAGITARAGRLHAVQLHGTFPEPDSPAASLPWILAAAVRDTGSLADVQRYLERCRAGQAMPAAVLLDAHVVGQFGGTGRTAPWDLLADFQPGVPLLLAGGLTPDNVAAAIRRVRPYGVDVASGVECAPGRKDREKMRRFIEEAKAAS